MDPWLLVKLANGSNALFGFAIQHAGTGGLSWVLSTPVVWIDTEAGRAETASGRRYTLGREVTVGTLPTVEARIAFTLLVAPHLADPSPLPPVPQDSAAVTDFLETHIERYRLLLDGRRPS
jgi:hypothetical protein